MKKEFLRSLPSVDSLLQNPEIRDLLEENSHSILVSIIRDVLADTRQSIMNKKTGKFDEKLIQPKRISEMVIQRLKERLSHRIRHAVNATGIILHTGLGRAVLPEKAVSAVNDVIKGYSTLATDTRTGKRSHRDAYTETLLCELTGAKAGAVYNNNAFATMLILNTLCQGKEVIVSRGQLVEIGGSFRMPDVMKASGAVLREVGTTNKTHLKDYSQAINKNTGAILHVHQSNYRIMGFTEEPPVEDLIKLAKKHRIPVIDDLGSGALVNLKKYGLEEEPLVQDSIRAGVDVACFSGDKLIGGPQCGIVVGKEKVLVRIKKNQLARAMRVGKMTLAALETTLELFFHEDKLEKEHPLYRMLSLNIKDLEKRAKAAAGSLRSSRCKTKVIETLSQVGSGSVPTRSLPSRAMQISPAFCSAGELAEKLRMSDPPVFARIKKESVLLDFRTIKPEEDQIIKKILKKILSEKEKSA